MEPARQKLARKPVQPVPASGPERGGRAADAYGAAQLAAEPVATLAKLLLCF